MEEYKIKFLNTFDPFILEEYKDKIFTLNKNYAPNNPSKFRAQYAPWCYENKYFDIGQKIVLRINKTEHKEFTYLNAIRDEYSNDEFKIYKSNIHILYPLFGIYLHILLEFTDGNLELIKNKIKITHEFQKQYRNNVIYLKTVINSIERNINLNTMIFNLKPTSGDLILWSYIYYKIRNGLNRNSFMETLLLMCKYYFNIDGIMFKDIRGKKMVIDWETGKQSKILSNLHYCLTINNILFIYMCLCKNFVTNIEYQIWITISNSDLYKSDLYYAFIDQFGRNIPEIKNNDILCRKAFDFTLK